MIEIYTDGAYNPILNQGAWAAVIIENKQKRALSGTARKSTSNRMEIAAALEGILATSKGSELSIHTDSQYLYGCMVKNWKRRVNNDLWEKLDKASGERKIHWNWIERNDNPFHKEAHSMATGLASNNDKSEKKEPETLQSEGEGKLTHIDEQGRLTAQIDDDAVRTGEPVRSGAVSRDGSILWIVQGNQLSAYAVGDALRDGEH